MFQGVVILFRVGFFFAVAYLMVANLARLGSRLVVRSQLGPSIQSGSSPSAGLQVVTQSTHLSKDCYPQLVSNPRRSEIQPPKQLDYRCMPLHPALPTIICHYLQKTFQLKFYHHHGFFKTYQVLAATMWLSQVLHYTSVKKHSHLSFYFKKIQLFFLSKIQLSKKPDVHLKENFIHLCHVRVQNNDGTVFVIINTLHLRAHPLHMGSLDLEHVHQFSHRRTEVLGR